MSFREVIAMALHGRSVRQAAMSMGMYQQKLDRFYKGQCLPDYDDAFKIAKESGMDAGEVFKILADEMADRKSKKTEKISNSFNWLIALANPRRNLIPA
ncbi:hypothetical protein ACNRBV_04140 [Ralstonia pseudosolanacearum]|uniref:XRE family transcriptional regulator n=1 Tax=Ralstonia solanacearum TaxID=305 RepID=A0ABY6NJ98_RALSL|nr:MULTISPECIES: hypothetical protein [Ralstonia]UZF17389.1 hypothetical protein LH706_25925 [Ralstonia solanacearum]MCK4140580.1 hypothetical protein [Ralstonia pseudosolanacearum]UQY85131.1 hypothetical protein JNO62_18040 [Ralstonia pseudosolanacearum]UZF27092.1 hypothetical protein LGV80_23575 [Ralstonia sp. RS642]UZF32144.1 hypothetical protein LGV82_23985 [Ralstonia sp. RS650]